MADFDTEREQFMAGVRRRESGGNYQARNEIGASGAYQFMPGTWRNAAGPQIAALYPEAYLAPPEIQDEVARRAMGGLFRQFGSWSDVAKAWLGGPGSVGKVVSDGKVTNVDYARQVLSYAGLDGSSPAPTMPNQPAATSTTSAAASNDVHDIGTHAHVLADMLSGLVAAPTLLTDSPVPAI